MDVRDRVVIVTGAGSGIGWAYAKALALQGAKVVLSDIREADPDVDELVSNHDAFFTRGDVRSFDDAQRIASEAVHRFGRIDALINNAALFTTLTRGPFEDISIERWRDVFEVNVLGTMNCTKAVTPAMKSQRKGKIINIASNVVHKGLPQLLDYVASKGAIVAMTRALAKELGSFGITVNAVAPGYILHQATSAGDSTAASSPHNGVNPPNGRNEKVVALRSIQRTLTPEDLVGTILYLCSPASDAVTGQTLVVDAGEVFA